MSEIMQTSLKHMIAFIAESQVIEGLLQPVLTLSWCPEIIRTIKITFGSCAFDILLA